MCVCVWSLLISVLIVYCIECLLKDIYIHKKPAVENYGADLFQGNQEKESDNFSANSDGEEAGTSTAKVSAEMTTVDC